jgi:hypothetical protein
VKGEGAGHKSEARGLFDRGLKLLLIAGRQVCPDKLNNEASGGSRKK